MINHINQLQQQYASAVIAAEKLREAAYEQPEPGVVEAYFEAARSRDECCAELQKALWIVEGIAA
jgi:hypothetical protein